MQFPEARQFANREEEIQVIAQKVEELVHGGYVKECLLNFYGVPGIGKTSLFAKLESIYCNLEQVVMVALSLARLGTHYKPNDLLTTKLHFLELLVHQFPHSIQETAQHELGRYPTTGITETHLTIILTLCSESLRRLDKPLLLLIDAWENVPETVFSWFERTLLLPLVQQNCCICVFGSQSELLWRQFDVRRRVQPYPLRALNKSAIQKQTGTEQNNMLGELIYKISCGHPLASETVYVQLHEGKKSEQWLDDNQHIVTEAVVNMLHQRTHKKISAELRGVLDVIALFREFDVYTLRSVVSKFIPELRNRSQSMLLASIKQLLETRFVSWNDEIRAYQLDLTVRKIFAQAVELKDYHRFKSIHEAAVAYYESLIRDVPGNRNVYLVEFYYHRLYTPNDYYTDEEEITKTFQTFLDNRTYARTILSDGWRSC